MLFWALVRFYTAIRGRRKLREYFSLHFHCSYTSSAKARAVLNIILFPFGVGVQIEAHPFTPFDVSCMIGRERLWWHHECVGTSRMYYTTQSWLVRGLMHYMSLLCHATAINKVHRGELRGAKGNNWWCLDDIIWCTYSQLIGFIRCMAMLNNWLPLN